MKKLFVITIASLAGALATAWAGNDLAGMADSKFYKVHPLFHPFPEETKPLQSVDRFGPVGIGIELHLPAFVMKVKNVEKDSPAEATGKLKPGQIIESINGQVLKDIDPRMQLGSIITQAEATDGKVKLLIRSTQGAEPEEVVVTIPVLGAYSKTWPLNCPKSDKIVRNMADYLAKSGNHAGPGLDMGLLFMLSTGEEQDLEVARGWIKELVANYKGGHAYPWHIGYGGPALCEYYLRTGDTSILPVIESLAEQAKKTMYNSGWNTHGNQPNYKYYSGGHMNAAGVHCVTFLLLAKECGVKVDEYTLQSSLKQFYRFAGKGNVAYGDHLPESGMVDNGKVGGLAFAMAAAASLTPDGEQSVYAKARDICAAKSFYSTSWMLHGHTGGGIGEIWRSAAMGLMHEKTPHQYREFMDNRMWHYELSRRFDGSFGILGGERYDISGYWGNAYPLAYTIPRKTLRLTGAAPSPYGKTYKLPDRPWGTAADDLFYSLTPAPDRNGKVQDVDAENLATDASWPISRRLSDASIGDDVLLMYCRHPEQGIRDNAAGVIYNTKRDPLIVELLKDKDPRARHSGATVACMFAAAKNRPAEPGRLTDEMVQLLLGIINDPAESWWTVRAALIALGEARQELLAPHIDRLCYWLQHDEWWLQNAAISAVVGLAADAKYAKQVLPLIGRMIASNRVMTLASQWGVMGTLRTRLQAAPPEVQALAVNILGQAYVDTPTKLSAPGGLDMVAALEVLIQEQAATLAGVPGGLNELYKRGTVRYPDRALPHQELYLNADPAGIGPELQERVGQIVRERVIPEFIGAGNRKLLMEEATSAVPFIPNYYYRCPRMEELVNLYNKIGVTDYNWHDFGPDLSEMKWDYFTFDPPETQLPGTGIRYRKVTYPLGMENWFAKDFDPKQYSWKAGLQPFGQENGKLVTERGTCKMDFCRCAEPMQTLWDKEVLLMRGTFKFPKFKEGYRYRLLVGGTSHVNAGEGFRVYVNGKQLMERTRGVDKREGANPAGYHIEKALWPDFESGETTLAAMSFLRIEPTTTRNRIQIWIQEMKAVPIGQKEILESIMAVPMVSSAWQALQDPDNAELDPEQGKIRWDGKFIPNEKAVGTWTQLGEVATMEAFTPSAKLSTNAFLPTKLTFAGNGGTDDPLLYYTDDILMHLNSNQALKMSVKSIGDVDYLFVEAGGFNTKNGPRWNPPLVVFNRVQL
ncbi:MAG TPA: hypothetical protein DCS43_14780 [Verrucomicrobia bacterium]|nr:hypothetical protein [Verrucomicrobiota bacterium]